MSAQSAGRLPDWAGAANPGVILATMKERHAGLVAPALSTRNHLR